MTVIKFRLQRESEDTIEARVFLGQEGHTMQLAGVIRFRVGEWQIVGAALGMGAEQTRGRLTMLVEGETEALR